ncbi:class I SAM-dependent methyltransferase [Pantoea coffeiphila]|uniref:class I SAM-dependent methyltransferase n=1 Tax=Pantoea coffeiphila TaxID=1465635 RepID=UPI00195F446E|nr:class I SAM-dependent methyltransferase [Pantoea coffeiphila]MBM7342984.1 ubiquinone/menaquinone biosynthesis C-methylase UbiE [Pantoea coffeiphila]
MASRHHDHVDKQFGEQAGAYLTSAVHASGRDLVKLSERLYAASDARVLDLGCGAGHASFIAAQHVKEVVAYDLSEKMLTVVAQTAEERGYHHLTTRQGYAEKLPFANDEFDIVISRYSAHHWHDVGSALREVRRVLKPGGKAIFMDVNAPGNPVLDIWLQTVEALRDTSHVRDYSPGEWLTLFTESGLAIGSISHDRLELEFTSWVERMRTPQVMVQAIRAYQHSAPYDVQRYYALQPDGSFTTDIIFIEASRP